MSDSYPESFQIEIEREKLCRYWRKEWTISSLLPCLGLGGFFGLSFGLGSKDQRNFESVMEVLGSISKGIGIGLVIGAAVATAIHFIFLRRAATNVAESLEVSVDGPFLRIKEGTSSVSDRKLHFRAIIDYTYFQDRMMRECGIGGIMLTTMAGGQNSTIRIRGIRNSLEIRDMLSEIDRLREGF